MHERRLKACAPIQVSQRCFEIIENHGLIDLDALITSGGGFSNATALPGWQKQAVLKYLNSGVTLPTGQFDPTKRAYPDVAANGHNYIIHLTGEETPVDG